MELLIVTGLSGAGKTHALKRLEDLGYFCVDNLPGEMLLGFSRLCGKTEPPIDRTAVVIDSRGNRFLSDVDRLLTALKEDGIQQKILYMDCRDEVLLRRYLETRRKHPMHENILEGIQLERELLIPFRDRASFVLDTSDLRPLESMKRLEALLQEKEDPFQLVVESFGYKRGIPAEADYVYDMRFCENPFYDPKLRNLSGLDAPVREFLERDEMFLSGIQNVQNMILPLLERFRAQGKFRVTVAFGCTGGQHRSVAAAEAFAKNVREKAPEISLKLLHRDIRLEQEDIQIRTKGE